MQTPQQSTIEMVATTFNGLEEVLATEIAALGASVTQVHKRAVSFLANKRLMYMANLHLRTALHIYVPLQKFIARTPEQLYRNISKIKWREHLKKQQTFAVSSVVNSSYFTHSKYAALKVKDAIVDQFRRQTGERPSVDVRKPDLQLHIHINEHYCTLYKDSSGDSLHKRGYRQQTDRAPLNEVLAAGMLLTSQWSGTQPFVDPMCGSGTIAIEAALIATKKAPGLYREHFGFFTWANFDKDLWEILKTQALKQCIPAPHPITAADNSPKAVAIARANVAHAQLSDSIEVKMQDFNRGKSHINMLNEEAEQLGGLLVINPPYGERLTPANIEQLYKRIGNTLKNKYPNCEAWILSANKDALKNIGLRSAKKCLLYNGALPCKYHKYELYTGTRRKKIVSL